MWNKRQRFTQTTKHPPHIENSIQLFSYICIISVQRHSGLGNTDAGNHTFSDGRLFTGSVGRLSKRVFLTSASGQKEQGSRPLLLLAYKNGSMQIPLLAWRLCPLPFRLRFALYSSQPLSNGFHSQGRRENSRLRRRCPGSFARRSRPPSFREHWGNQP